jgi:hypothetical protein
VDTFRKPRQGGKTAAEAPEISGREWLLAGNLVYLCALFVTCSADNRERAKSCFPGIILWDLPNAIKQTLACLGLEE